MTIFSIRSRASRLAVGLWLAGLTLAGPVLAADEPREVELKAPLLICRELAGGARAPTKEEVKLEHDLVFFVLAGRNADGSEIRQVAPKSGGHLKIDNRRKGMIVKEVSLWKGTLREGETVTFALIVREQDGQDSAEGDLKEARGRLEDRQSEGARRAGQGAHPPDPPGRTWRERPHRDGPHPPQEREGPRHARDRTRGGRPLPQGARHQSPRSPGLPAEWRPKRL